MVSDRREPDGRLAGGCRTSDRLGVKAAPMVQERESQAAPVEVADAAKLPSADEIRRQEVIRTLQGMLRLRPIILPVVLTLVLGLILIEPTRDRVLAWLVLAAIAAVIAVTDRLRARHVYRANYLLLDLSIAVLIQSVLIATTGLIESPILPVYLLLALLAGVALGPTLHYHLLLLLIISCIWLMAFAEVRGALTSMPAFFRPSPELATDPLRVYTRAAVTTFILLVARHIAGIAHRAMLRMVESAIQARQQLLVGLADRNRELVTLSGAIAHELKNPLASIQGLVQLVERGQENREKRFEVLRREIDRMKTTLDEFLNFSRPLGELTVSVIDSAELFEELAVLHEASLQRKGLSVAAVPRGDVFVRGDRRKLQQALMNLLQNAIDASPANVAIEWVARRAPGVVSIGVADRGPGLPESLRDRIGAPGATTKPEGSGIGLLVARVIAEQHGGRLLLMERSGGGLEALLELPEVTS